MGVDDEGGGGGAAPVEAPGKARTAAEKPDGNAAAAAAPGPRDKPKKTAEPVEKTGSGSKRNAGAGSLPVHAKPFVPSAATTPASKANPGLRNLAQPFVPSQKPAGRSSPHPPLREGGGRGGEGRGSREGLKERRGREGGGR